ncbi:hypothetical protein [Rhizobium sp. L1K21]|uniref:hypothetical protein n=1 Tax=Rhizobium sp. L1K21 TaxID=2954933 RepID=UPI002093424B|nr:hypothetical protein [Rhizobium sp. L1K21]MCO6187526.1 hypothetical protein [Rhizobium sp. L1K21]
MKKELQSERDAEKSFDARDRLILALYAQLKAERETRGALEDAIRNGALSKEVLTAIASDPIPVITDDDVVEVEHLLDRGSPIARIDRNGKDK